MQSLLARTLRRAAGGRVRGRGGEQVGRHPVHQLGQRRHGERVARRASAQRHVRAHHERHRQVGAAPRGGKEGASACAQSLRLAEHGEVLKAEVHGHCQGAQRGGDRPAQRDLPYKTCITSYM
jgi:hypothetical protein